MGKKDHFKELLAESEARLMEHFASAGVERTKPWTVKEYAEHYGCSEPTVYGMLNAGTLEAFYIGKGTSSIRITPESVIRNDESRKYVPQHGRTPIQRKENCDA